MLGERVTAEAISSSIQPEINCYLTGNGGGKTSYLPFHLEQEVQTPWPAKKCSHKKIVLKVLHLHQLSYHSFLPMQLIILVPQLHNWFFFLFVFFFVLRQSSTSPTLILAIPLFYKAHQGSRNPLLLGTQMHRPLPSWIGSSSWAYLAAKLQSRS